MDEDNKIRKQLENSIKEYRANEEHFEMIIRASAEMLFMRFGYLVKAGFTETQALDIIKARGLE